LGFGRFFLARVACGRFFLVVIGLNDQRTTCQRPTELQWL